MHGWQPPITGSLDEAFNQELQDGHRNDASAKPFRHHHADVGNEVSHLIQLRVEGFELVLSVRLEVSEVLLSTTSIGSRANESTGTGIFQCGRSQWSASSHLTLSLHKAIQALISGGT